MEGYLINTRVTKIIPISRVHKLNLRLRMEIVAKCKNINL